VRRRGAARFAPASAVAVALSMLLGSAGMRCSLADDPEPLSEKEKAEKRLEFMLQALGRYEVVYPGNPPRKSRLHEKALLRWSNPLTTVKDGGLAVFTRGGRPDVVVEVQLHGEQTLIHEFSPILDGGMELRRSGRAVFKADHGWFKFQDLPDAPRPADKPAQRLTQMRKLAGRFTVIDAFGFEEIQNYNLRLMPTPVYRYEEADEKIDGGMFVFAQGTNPEAVLLLEARPQGDKPGWRFGFAPTTIYELTARLDGEEGRVVWSKPRYMQFNMASGPYLSGRYPMSPDDIDLKGMMPDPSAKSAPPSKADPIGKE
jgi:hypothetical protein